MCPTSSRLPSLLQCGLSLFWRRKPKPSWMPRKPEDWSWRRAACLSESETTCLCLSRLIVSAIRRSLELAEAMESRAWGATKKRTNLYSLKLHKGDYALIAVTVAVLAVAILVWLFVPIPFVSSFF